MAAVGVVVRLGVLSLSPRGQLQVVALQVGVVAADSEGVVDTTTVGWGWG